MALANPSPNSTISQQFGPTNMAVQPAMFHTGDNKAYWLRYPGSTFSDHVHAGTDFTGAGAGSALLAMETGTVVRSTYDGVNGGGHVVEVEIRPGVRYSFNHCQSRNATVGQVVKRGQKIATMGATGTILLPNGQKVRSAYGVHCHTVFTIREVGSDGVTRTMLYNLTDFMAGGSQAGSTLIKPAVKPPAYKKVTLKQPVNVRSTPDLDVGATNIVFITRADGIYTVNGVKVGPITTTFELRGTVSNDDGTWGILYGLGRTVNVMNGLYA